MVFSKLLNTINSAFDNSKKNIRKRNIKPINELQQGMQLLQSRKQVLNILSNKQLMSTEPMSSGLFKEGEDKLNSVNKKELDALKKMETDFNKSLSSYSQKYKSFMENYYRAVESVEKCKSDCLTKYPPGSVAESFNKQACKAGCDLKGPYVSKCEDTFTKSRIGNQDCAQALAGKCIDGQVQLGQDSYVDDINRADSNNITLRKGCCACGGGGGGPPSVQVRGTTVKKCSEMPKAFGYNDSEGEYIKTTCLTAPVPAAQKNLNDNLYNEYDMLKSENIALIKQAENIFEKIKKFNLLKGNLNIDMKSKRDELQNSLDEYSTVYSKIQEAKKYGVSTINGQVEDIYLKEKNQLLQLGIWGSLAILLVLITLDRLRK